MKKEEIEEIINNMYKEKDKVEKILGNKNIKYFIKREKDKIIKKYYISNS